MLPNEHSLVRPVFDKSADDLRNEWDNIAMVRQRQMASGQDLSYRHVLLPTIVELLEGCDLTGGLDVGCGTGEPTKTLASIAEWVVGVDASRRSVDIAIANRYDRSNTAFYASLVEDFAQQWTGPCFTAAVANMTLMACLDLNALIEAVAKLLAPAGRLVATITHPWFWPYYWQYSDAIWFQYNQEIVLEGPFRISLDRTEFTTTHVHRPMSSYMDALSQAGFVIDRVVEPIPDQTIQSLYPKRWDFPRFLAFRAVAKL